MPYPIRVFSRIQACDLPPEPNTLVISFHDPAEGPAPLKEGWHSIVRIECHDSDIPSPGITVFSPEHASLISTAIAANPQSNIIVHCQLGQSRSCAAALALSEFLNIPCLKAGILPITTSSYPIYNKHVYGTLLHALHGVAPYTNS